MIAGRAKYRATFLLGLGIVLLLGCEDEPAPTPQAGQPKAAKTPRPPQPQQSEETEAETEKDGLPRLKETDFIESSKRRDPFKFFVELLEKKEEIQKLVQREVKLKEYDVAELKLIGIITKIGDPRAMVTVPDGSGFVLKRGDYLGRADFVQRGKTGEAIQVNWRVARIHGSGKEEERGIYLIRDDPTTSKGVDITRFIPLHQE